MVKDSDCDVPLLELARDQARALRAAQIEVKRRVWQRLRSGLSSCVGEVLGGGAKGDGWPTALG
jgi:hypothetical protein